MTTTIPSAGAQSGEEASARRGPAICFVDTETTCLGHRARPWEIAVIRREPNGDEETWVVQVQYELNGLPPGTSPQALYIGGWLSRGVAGSDYIWRLGDDIVARAYGHEEAAAHAVHRLFRNDPILVGVGVHFDAAVLSAMFLRHELPEEPWHYAIVDLKAASWGAINDSIAHMGEAAPAGLTELTAVPLRSEPLAAAGGVEPPTEEERHTALGDARWAARWYDALTGGAA